MYRRGASDVHISDPASQKTRISRAPGSGTSRGLCHPAFDRQEDDMETKTIEDLFERQVGAFTGSPEFEALEAGRGDYDAFIENVARAHLKSPQLVAFLYAL